MDEIVLQSFPKNEVEALAMLYLQNQELDGLSPVELLKIYQKACEEIRNELHDQYAARFEEL